MAQRDVIVGVGLGPCSSVPRSRGARNGSRPGVRAARSGSGSGCGRDASRMASRAPSASPRNDRVEDGQVLALQPALIFALLHQLGRIQGEVMSQGMARCPAHRAPRRRTGCWSPRRWRGERRSRPAGRLAERSSRSNSKKASWIAASCDGLRRIGGERRALDLDGDADFEHVERGGDAAAHLGGQRAEGRGRVVDARRRRRPAATRPARRRRASRCASRTTVRLTPNCLGQLALRRQLAGPGAISPAEPAAQCAATMPVEPVCAAGRFEVRVAILSLL